MDTAITVNSRHFDGSVSKSWTCELLERDGSLLVLSEYSTEKLGMNTWALSTRDHFYEYYWRTAGTMYFAFTRPMESFAIIIAT